jgi:hypothetical protein
MLAETEISAGAQDFSILRIDRSGLVGQLIGAGRLVHRLPSVHVGVASWRRLRGTRQHR